MPHRRGDKLLLHGPPKHRADHLDAAIDCAAIESVDLEPLVSIDQPLTEGFQPLRRELFHRLMAVHPEQRADRKADIRSCALVGIVRFDPFPIFVNHHPDRHALRLISSLRRKLAAVGEPFRYEAVVLLPSSGTTVLAKVMALMAQFDECAVRALWTSALLPTHLGRSDSSTWT